MPPTDDQQPALEPTEALGELCRQQRERYGYSLREAAAKIGVSFSVITRVEHGLSPSFKNYLRLAKWLGLPHD